jgi:hypothetical protein
VNPFRRGNRFADLGYKRCGTEQSAALMEVAAGTLRRLRDRPAVAGAMFGDGTVTPTYYTVALNSEKYGVGFRKEATWRILTSSSQGLPRTVR